MRVLLALTLCLSSLLAHADEHELLYQLAGWPQQREHFSAAIDSARLQYRNSLPQPLYQQLDATAQRRFQPQALQQRMLGGLRQQLPDPLAAIRFFDSPTGRAVVAAEVQASAPAEVKKHPNGLPVIAVSPQRQQLLDRLARALPAREASVEMGMAVGSLAAESFGGLLGGLGGDPQQLLEGQRQQMAARIEKDLPVTLRWVYRQLSDAQLGEFVRFAESAQGALYYRAAIVALRQALAG